MTFLPFILVLASSAALGWALLVWAYARTLLSPPRMTDAKAFARLGRMSPADLGLAHRELTFRGEGDVALAAWWIPAEGSPRTAILLHSFGDAKVGALAWAPAWRELGFNLLLVDLRAHGDSGGTTLTGGILEAADLSLVIVQLLALHPTATEWLALFGASYGAAVACCYATRGPDERLKALVLDSPVESFSSDALAHATQVGMPGPWVGRAALRLAAWQTGVNIESAAVARTLSRVQIPTLLIAPERDAYLSPDGRAALAAAFADGPGSLRASAFWQPRTTHLLAINAEPVAYRRHLTALVATLGPR